MTDYISREAAILVIQRYGVGCIDADDFTPEQAERFTISSLKAIPAADVVEVVRCKDCKYYFKDDGYEMCENSEGYDWTTEDGFCAWAVKREADE